jgi:hypothetical protein
MARAESLPVEVLSVVAEQIGAMLPGVYDQEQLSEASFEICETFELWVLGLDAITQPLNDLRLLTNPVGLWHQVRLDGQAQVFARSIHLGAQPESWRVVEVFQSKLAGKIDEAIDRIDRKVDDEWLARLLVVPEYQVHAFWLLNDEGAGQVSVVACPAQLAELLRVERLLSQEEFLEALRGTLPITGYTLA